MKLAFNIAARFLKFNKGQTVLIILGIAIGVSVQIFIGLLIQGLQAGLIDKTIGGSPQITVQATKEEKVIEDYASLLAEIEGADSRIKDVSVSAESPGFISFGDFVDPVLLRGFDLTQSEGIYHFSEKITEGTLPVDKEALVGVNLQEELGLKLGDTVTINTATGSQAELKISGFFDFKVAAINKSWIITNLSTTQGIFDFSSAVTSIEMKVTDVFAADVIALAVENELNNPKLVVENWKDQNAELLSGLNGQSVSSIMIQVFVLIAVVLGIASVLAITVIQKSKQIGILKAMGIKDAVASLIFLFQGLILGIFGAIAGILLGLFLCISFTKFALNPDGTPVIPLYINYGFIAFSGAIALFSALGASLIPARTSSKLSPIEVIKNG
ncbi:MAG: ABC transporter permease [Vallitaleaceae bacterium]|nr:ABC transporter permease [Vallitaleaceae bacterium]